MINQNKSFKILNIRHENIKQIINLIKNSNTKLSRADIARKSSLSSPAISSIINTLIKKNIIIETDEENGQNTVGRNPILLKLNKNCGYILGILILKDKLTIAIANYTGGILKKHSFYYKENQKKCIDFLLNSVKNLLEECKIDINKLLSISISFPGNFDSQKQEIIFAPHSGFWQNVPIVSRLKEEYNCQVKIENNVNAAVLGEKWRGKIGSKKNAVYLKLGNGIAAGLLINNKLFRGSNNLAGEVGFSVTDSSHLEIDVADSGVFEQKYNIDQILKRINLELETKNFDFSDLSKVLNKNQKIKKIIKEINTNIEMLIINIISVLNPGVIILGGSYSKIIFHSFGEFKKEIKNNVPFAPELLISDLEDDVYYLGAIANSLQTIENQLIKNYFME